MKMSPPSYEEVFQFIVVFALIALLFTIYLNGDGLNEILAGALIACCVGLPISKGGSKDE